MTSTIKRDYIVEQGTSGNWTYIKYKNGIVEQFLNETLSNSITTAVGQLYQSPSNISRTPPITMKKVLSGDVQAQTSQYSVWAAIYQLSTSSIAFRLLSTASRTAANYQIYAHIIGTY